MAMGARKAFSEIPENERARWMKIPITGCDGMPKTGQAWVRNGTLAATIYIRPNTDLAIEMLVEAFKGGAAAAGAEGDGTGVGAVAGGSGKVGEDAEGRGRVALFSAGRTSGVPDGTPFCFWFADSSATERRKSLCVERPNPTPSAALRAGSDAVKGATSGWGAASSYVRTRCAQLRPWRTDECAPPYVRFPAFHRTRRR